MGVRKVLTVVLVLGGLSHTQALFAQSHTLREQGPSSGEKFAPPRPLAQEHYLHFEVLQDVHLQKNYSLNGVEYWNMYFPYKKHASTILKDAITLSGNHCVAESYAYPQYVKTQIHKGDIRRNVPVRVTRFYDDRGKFDFTAVSFQIGEVKISCQSRYEDFSVDDFIDAVQAHFKVSKSL